MQYTQTNVYIYLFSVVAEASLMLQMLFSKCLVKSFRIQGDNRIASQTAFYKASEDGTMQELTHLLGDHQLSMWLSLETFTKALDESTKSETVHPTTSVITAEERDIAHYIGGAVVSKLKHKCTDDESCIYHKLISEEAPKQGTLLHAKSRGKLTNLTADSKCLFVEMEQLFRDTFPTTAATINAADFQVACYKNQVIQDCFFSSVSELDNTSSKEKVISKIIQLYFKIRIHHNCKIILDSVRSKNKKSNKDRALRAKLAR